jgi:transcriptional regulator with XRE-family HTH domain
MIGVQRKIAQGVGVSDAFIAQLLKGSKRPSWTTAKKLGAVTGTDPAFWMESGPEEIREFVGDLEADEIVS